MNHTANKTPRLGRAETILAIGLILVLMVMLLPLPPALMDLLLSLNISFSILLVSLSFFISRPLEISSFPSLLLLATLLRLSLNVATTRLILLFGYQGTAAAGRVIETFGQFVVGGNFVVGAIVFFILIIINFVVITKGAGRVAEVAARFTLDALPGKQMAIDAELASGAIGEEEARHRRHQLELAADFYGAMDGASKFVRGDAIAGLIITAINIVGGLVVGVAQHQLSLGEAARTFTILSIGDGLVSQMPALMVSTAAGLVVTKAASGGPLAQEVGQQIGQYRSLLRLLAPLLLLFGLIPGMPALILWPLGVLAFWLSRLSAKAVSKEDSPPPQTSEDTPESIRQLLPYDILELELGYGLIKLVNGKASDLLQRIKALRKQLALELGLVIPPVHIRDNMRLEAEQYRILIRGTEVGKGRLFPDRLMAMSPSGTLDVDGIRSKEPAFGMEVVWILPAERSRVEAAGGTAVECSTVVVTHLAEVIRVQAAELLGRQELQELLDLTARQSPRLVEELIPKVLTAAEVGRVLKLLLGEGVSIRDLTTILETLADEAPLNRDPIYLLEAVRRRLGKTICQKLADEEGKLQVLMLDSATELLLRNSLVQGERGRFLSLDLKSAQQLIHRVQNLAVNLKSTPVLVVAPDLRRPLFDLLGRFVPQLQVLSHQEIPPRVEIRTLGLVALSDSASPRLGAEHSPLRPKGATVGTISA